MWLPPGIDIALGHGNTPFSIEILFFSLYSTTFKETGSVTYVSHLLQCVNLFYLKGCSLLPKPHFVKEDVSAQTVELLDLLDYLSFIPNSHFDFFKAYILYLVSLHTTCMIGL